MLRYSSIPVSLLFYLKYFGFEGTYAQSLLELIGKYDMAIHFFSIQCQDRVPSSHWSFRKCCGENVEVEGALIMEVSGMVLYRRTGWQLWGYLG